MKPAAVLKSSLSFFNVSNRIRKLRAGQRWTRRRRWTNPGSIVPQRSSRLRRYRVALFLAIAGIALYLSGLFLGGKSNVKPYSFRLT